VLGAIRTIYKHALESGGEAVDALEIERAVFVGHDWGGFIAWAMAILHPERVLGVAEAGMDRRVRPIPARILRTGAPLEELVRFAFADGRLDMNPFLNPEKWPPAGEPLRRHA